MAMAVGQDYWDTAYDKLALRYNPDNVQFKELFDRYLKPGNSCFEVGCYPGNYLVYLCRRFGYSANGIDTTPFVLTRLPNFLAEHQVKIGDLYHGDFLKFKFHRTYDVVCSFGFIEHFFNFEEVIEKHIRLVNDSGILVLSCPNFRGMQFVFHRLLDPVNLQHHVLPAMNLRKWKEILERNGMRILYQGYYRTADFWVDTPRQGFLSTVMIKYIQRITKQIDRHLNWPNPLLSPYMISFSQKHRVVSRP